MRLQKLLSTCCLDMKRGQPVQESKRQKKCDVPVGKSITAKDLKKSAATKTKHFEKGKGKGKRNVSLVLTFLFSFPFHQKKIQDQEQEVNKGKKKRTSAAPRSSSITSVSDNMSVHTDSDLIDIDSIHGYESGDRSDTSLNVTNRPDYWDTPGPSTSYDPSKRSFSGSNFLPTVYYSDTDSD